MIRPPPGRRSAPDDARMTSTVSGRLVLDDRVTAGRITIEGGRIASIDLDDEPAADARISPPGSWTSMSTAGVATTRWAIPPRSMAWLAGCCVGG